MSFLLAKRILPQENQDIYMGKYQGAPKTRDNCLCDGVKACGRVTAHVMFDEMARGKAYEPRDRFPSPVDYLRCGWVYHCYYMYTTPVNWCSPMHILCKGYRERKKETSNSLRLESQHQGGWLYIPLSSANTEALFFSPRQGNETWSVKCVTICLIIKNNITNSQLTLSDLKLPKYAGHSFL